MRLAEVKTALQKIESARNEGKTAYGRALMVHLYEETLGAIARGAVHNPVQRARLALKASEGAQSG